MIDLLLQIHNHSEILDLRDGPININQPLLHFNPHLDAFIFDWISAIKPCSSSIEETNLHSVHQHSAFNDISHVVPGRSLTINFLLPNQMIE